MRGEGLEYEGAVCKACGEPTVEIEKLFPSDTMPSGVRSQMVRVCTDPDCPEYDEDVKDL